MSELPEIVVDCVGGEENADGTITIYLKVPLDFRVEIGSKWRLAPYVADEDD